jgi:hypothetical protein
MDYGSRRMLYGWTTAPTLADAGDVIAAALDVDFQLRDSFYYGGDYLLAKPANAELRIVPNFIEDDGQHFEPDFPHCPMLLLLRGEVSDVSHAALATLPALRRLR